jgi:ABC-2 type transport system permease protein
MSTPSQTERIGARPRPRRDYAAGPILRLAARQFADGRRLTLSFGLLFAVVAYIQPVAYRHSYPTVADRLNFARSFGSDTAIRLFYGAPHDLLSVGGYTAWRAGAVLALLAGAWAAVATTRALRGEEDAGRSESLLALPIARGQLFAAALLSILAQIGVLATLVLIGLVAAGLPVLPSAFLVLAALSTVPVFAGVAAVTAQLAATRRAASRMAAGILFAAFAVRVVADTVSGAGTLRWVTPLGWVEQLRAFAHPAPGVLLVPLAVAAALLTAAARIARVRDMGAGLLAGQDARDARPRLLGSVAGFAARGEMTVTAAWLVGVTAFGVILGVISASVSTAGIPPSLRHELARMGAGSVATPVGYLGFAFTSFVVALSVFACSQIATARSEELAGRVATMLALPVGRARFLATRLSLAASAAAVISLTAAMATWAGAHAAGVSVSAGSMVLAAANGLAVAILFLGLGAVAYALAPRSASAIAYGLLITAFLWQLFGTLLGAPTWLVDVSPFVHLGLAPGRAFRPGSAVVITLIGASGAAIACGLFARRDLVVGD